MKGKSQSPSPGSKSRRPLPQVWQDYSFTGGVEISRGCVQAEFREKGAQQWTATSGWNCTTQSSPQTTPERPRASLTPTESSSWSTSGLLATTRALSGPANHNTGRLGHNLQNCPASPP